jgi:crossover junction endodeoxyribonuclease RuvC
MDHPDPFSPGALAALDGKLVPGNVRGEADPSTLNVLALDLGTEMGWALRTAASVSSGHMTWTVRRHETRGHRLLRFWRWMNNIQSAQPLALVAYEEVQFLGGAPGRGAAGYGTSSAFAQFEGTMMMFGARHGVPVVGVPVSTLKKAVTGTGRHPKGQGKIALAAAVRQLGYGFDTQDEADALAVLQWATRLRGST